ncbi:MAG: alpha/beta hydrolase [Limnobacter sp.]|nr:alpha/beta hydrolase [Limnobacter sp.]
MIEKIQLPKLAKQYALKKVISGSLRASFKMASTLPLPLKVLRETMERSSLIFRVRKDVQAIKVNLDGVDALRLDPETQEGGRVILHLHGGAFFGGSANTHRPLCSQIAARAKARLYILEYRLAPENPYPAALDDCLAAYQALLGAGIAAEKITLAGDSAGGNLILALALRLRDSGLPMPANLVMLSPFLNLTVSSPSVEHLAHHDPMLTRSILMRGGDAYRGPIPAQDPRVSPVFAELKGLPPTLLQCGSQEVLLDDTLLFQKQASAAGVDVRCKVFPGMWHNFQMFCDALNTASDALDEIAQFISSGAQSPSKS